ncbi:MAG: cytochrome c, partial [Actinomycetia bacterium]|nr:cytochrome c [Actinomycetes bacterium]
QSCHGPDAEGLEKLGLPLVDSEFVASMSSADLLAFIKTGRAASDPENTTGVDMPVKGGNPALSDEDLIDIVAYLKSIN